MDIYLCNGVPEGGIALMAGLRKCQHRVRQFDTTHALLTAMERHRPDLVVLHPCSLEEEGLAVLGCIRRFYGSALPVFMVIVEAQPEKVVQALTAGADDCIGGPVITAVLSARVEALLRRVAPTTQPDELQIARGPYRLDYRKQLLSVEGRPVVLTPKEFDLAWALFSHPDGFIPREKLVAAVWGKSVLIAGHTFAQHEYLLRKKLQFQAYGFRLTAVYGAGYRMESAPLVSTHNMATKAEDGINEEGQQLDLHLLAA